MIKLPEFEFKYCCASGALGFDGRGYLWERPFIDPNILTIITKTVTFSPRKGNFCWWKFWQTFKINSKRTINAFGLPNKGYKHWIMMIYPKIRFKNIIPSICPFTTDEAKIMTMAINELSVRAIEVNISCPNSIEKFDIIEIVNVVVTYSKHPVIVKIGISHNYLRLCEVFGEKIIIDEINTVPWGDLNKTPSPLYPFEGGYSDEDTGRLSKFILKDIKQKYPKIQVINGNGIFNYEEAKLRFDLGADAISFGTIFVLTPWRPKAIIESIEGG